MRDLTARAWAGGSFDDLGIIDMHCHMGGLRQFYIPDCGIDAMLKSAAKIAVKNLCVAPHMAISYDNQQGNEMALEAVCRYPERVMAWLVLNPNHPEEYDKLFSQYWSIPQFIGVKIHPEWQGEAINGKSSLAIFERLERQGGCALVHTWHGSRFCSPLMCIDAIKQFPKVPFIFAHAGGTWRGVREVAAIVNKYPNAYVDTSGLEYLETPFEEFVDMLDNTKILFGSDIPYHDIRIAFSRVIFAEIDDEIKSQIFSGNFKKMFAFNPKATQ